MTAGFLGPAEDGQYRVILPGTLEYSTAARSTQCASFLPVRRGTNVP